MKNISRDCKQKYVERRRELIERKKQEYELQRKKQLSQFMNEFAIKIKQERQRKLDMQLKTSQKTDEKEKHAMVKQQNSCEKGG